MSRKNPPFWYNICGSPTANKIKKEDFVIKDNNSLAHSTWNCKYHLVFAPKYRRMQIYGQIRKDIGVILRRLCEQKGVEIIEAELCPDHIHMLVSIPPKYSVASIMGYLKGKSSLMIFDRHANLKYKYGNRHFWCKGYYVDTVGKNKKAIEEYIKNSAGMTYISSRGLKKADVYDYSNIEFDDWTYENDFCKIKDFLIAEMPRDLLLQLTGGQNEKI